MKPDVAMDWQINRAPSPRGEGIPASMFLPNPLQSSSRTPIPGKLTAPHLLGRLTAPSNAARGRAYFVNPPGSVFSGAIGIDSTAGARYD
jgi:hypothetical protein